MQKSFSDYSFCKGQQKSYNYNVLITLNFHSPQKQRNQSASDIPREHKHIHGINISEKQNWKQTINNYRSPKTKKQHLLFFLTNEFQKDVDHYTSFNSMSSNEVTRIQKIMEYGTNAKSNPHNYNNTCNFKRFDLYLSSKTNLIWCHVNWLQQLRHSISRNLIMKNLDITPNQSTNIRSLFCL